MARKKGPTPTQNNATSPEAAGVPEADAQGLPCPVVGIGGSAGALEAFSELLHHLPSNTGLSPVFIQHLDPKHDSLLAELLSRSTRMPVVQATNGMKVEPNHVYIIPPDTSITIASGVLKVAQRAPGVLHMPIDAFFRSLAEDQGPKAIGVVLSGMASDGTLGLNAIKANGGITFAQAPVSAKFDGMPRSAIAAGSVDFVLPPKGIADELVRLSRHSYLSEPSPAEPARENEGQFGEIFSMLRAATGVDFSYYKPGTIRRRTLRRIALNKLDGPGEYVRFLKEHREELDQLFQDLLINVTGFFREPATFNALRSRLLPSMFKGRPPGDPFRVWVPGCSTGQEVYSVAICILEHIREARIEVPVQIFGTDLSDSALQRARAGVYPDSIAAEVSPDRLRRFFVRTDGAYQIARFVRDACVFARQNVTKDPPFSRLDLITCRNVMIYLGPTLQGRVMRLFHYALKQNGYLLLGASEHIGGVGEALFEPVDKQHRIFMRKPAAAAITTDFDAHEERARVHVYPAPQMQELSLTESQARVDRMILARYSPPSVVVDRTLRVSQFRGDTSPYLGHASGHASLDLTRLARGGLGPEIRRVVEKAESSSAPARTDSIAFTGEDGVKHLSISAAPIHGLPEAQFLVVFEPVAPPEPAPRPSKPGRAGKQDGARVHDLEQELISTRQYLQSIIEEQEAATEELKSAHEEVQSSNEELQSTNEELLTAKEELQSTNEELVTVNDEMQTRNSELQQINNDLLNLLSSVNIPIVMLGNDLRIRRFTPQAEKILNLIPADVGRPVSDFRVKINVPDLVEVCYEVIQTLAPKEREVEDSEGRVYSMWLRPYRTADNRIDGVVLALVDVTERKRAAEARFRRLFEAAKDGMVIVDAANGDILDCNPFVSKMLGYPRSRVVGSRYWESDLFRGTEIDQSILQEVREREAVHKTVRMTTESGESVEAELVASLYTEGERQVVQFNIRDVTARRRLEERASHDQDQLREAQKMEAVGRLAGGVGHDFNDILTAVIGFAGLLQDELPPDHPGWPLVEQIRTEAERAAVLTKQLVAFGRRQVVIPKVLDPNQVIGEMRQMIDVMLHDETQLVVDVQPNVGCVKIDRTQLEQVVLNLVLNARDAVEDSGTITVSTAREDVDQEFSARHPAVPMGRYVAISVKDTGTGMDEETQRHIFEPFFTTKPKGKGVGLGLATVNDIAGQNGGSVWAYSESGLGSTFTVYLPRVDDGQEPAEAAATPEQWNGTETVMVVEDEPCVRRLAKRLLATRGYQVLEASSGPDGLRVAREHAGPIHLMITDLVMTRMSGRELAFQLAASRPEMRVLYMSGHTEDAIIPYGVLENGLALLQKPFTQGDLLSLVRQLLDSGEKPAEEAGAGSRK